MDTPQLIETSSGLCLSDGELSLSVDFAEYMPRVRRGLSHELLVRAAKLKGTEHPTAFDMTAGLGTDSFLLAAAGFDVTMCELDPVIAALLADALKRGIADESLAAICSRMHLLQGDAIELLAQQSASLDVVYLDPMFPERKKSAAVKKKFQLLHQLERPCADEKEMLAAAVAARPRKIIVKRPAKGEYLAGKKPSYSLAGKAIRFDVLIP